VGERRIQGDVGHRRPDVERASYIRAARMPALRRLTVRPRMLATGWLARARHFLPGPLPADYDDATVAVIRQVRRHTMTSPARLEALIRATEHVVAARVPGAFVECGVWRGGSMMAVALTLRRLGATDRELVLFDTFTGMTEPGSEDADSPYDGYSLHRMWRRRSQWSGVPAAEVRAALESTGYPMDRVRLVEGPVEQTLPAAAPERVALLRLDTDWYASTRAEMEHLYPRLAAGGVLVLDDYGHYSGARRAVDEGLAAHGERLLLQRIDYTGRIAIRP
jgi:O-methyltransferase